MADKMLTVERLALALRATAASYRWSEPSTIDALETLAEYLSDPKAADARIAAADATDRKLRRIR